MPRKVPVYIRGKHYESMRVAAHELGLHPNTIVGAMARGSLESVGNGSNRDRSIPIIVNGELYESISKAAYIIGEHRESLAYTVSQMNRYGRKSRRFKKYMLEIPK